MGGAIRIGTQGWNYQDWVGSFYPSGTRSADFLPVYARAFDAVEVDSSFYAVPAASTLRAWADRTPPGFLFCLKMPQEVTHEHRLRDPGATTELFFDRVRELGDKLGPTLVQLGPDFEASELPALLAFLDRVPNDVRVAVEFRHKSWMHDGVYAVLRERGIALALVDGKWIPRRTIDALTTRPTANFAYIRWIGPDRDIADYSRVQIDRSRDVARWTQAIESLAAQVELIVGYVNNHYSGHSPATVREFQRAFGLRVVEPETLGEQLRLL